MSEQEKQEGQKTVVAFIAGLLVGGLLVWVFSSSPETTTPNTNVEGEAIEVEVSETNESDTEGNTDTTDDTNGDSTTTNSTDEATVTVGEGAIDVTDQSAAMAVDIDGAVYPVAEGWIAVRAYNDGQLGNILGAARFSQEQGLAPDSVPLLVPTVAGNEYAVVYFTDDGNREFNLDGDVQLDVVMETFTAN